MNKFTSFIIKFLEKARIIHKVEKVVLPLYQKYLLKKQHKNFTKYGAELLFDFRETLEQNGLKFWLTCGTLLGAYREKRLLGHDCDLDVAMFAEDQEKAASVLLDAGFTMIHQLGVVGENIKEQSFVRNGAKIDILYVEKTDDKFVAHVFFKNRVSAQTDDFNVIKIFFPKTDFIEYDFLGAKYLIPEKTEEYLAANYGPDFMTPNKSWDYRKDIPAAQYYTLEEKRGFCIHNK